MKFKSVQDASREYYAPNTYVNNIQGDMLGDLPNSFVEQVGDSLGYHFSPIMWSIRNGKEFEVDQAFRPEDHIDFALEEDTHTLLDAVSQQHLDHLRRQNQFNREVKRKSSEAGFFAHMTGALLDPLTWAIPFSIYGKTVTAGIKSGAKSGLAYGAISEGIRAPFDTVGTLGESASNIAMATALGGVVGGAIKSPYAFRAMRSTAKKVTQHEKDLNTPILKGSDDLDKPYDLADGTTNPISGFLQGGARKVLKGSYPQEIKKNFLELIGDSSFLTNLQKTGKGNIQSVNGTMGRHLGHLGKSITALEDIHHQFIMGRSKFNKQHKAPRIPITGVYMGGSGIKGLFTGRSDFDDFLQKVLEYRFVELGNKEFTWNGVKYRGDRIKKQVNRDAYESSKDARIRIFGTEKLHPLHRKAIDEMNSFFQEEGAQAMEVGLLNYRGLRGLIEFRLNTKIPESIDYWKQATARWEKKNRDKLAKLQKQFADKTRGLTDKQIKFKNKLEKDINYIQARLKNFERELVSEQKALDDLLEAEKTIAPPLEENHFARMYDHSAIVANREAFTKLVEAWFKAKPSKNMFDSELGKFVEVKFRTDPKGLRERAEKFVKKLLKETEDEEFIDNMLPLKTSFLNSRQFDAPNWFRANVGTNGKAVQVSDFINKSYLDVAKTYVMRIGPKIEFAKIFNGKKVRQVMDDMKDDMKDFGNTDKEITDALGAFKLNYDRLVGQVKTEPHRWDNVVASEVRKLAQVVYLGGSGVASIADMGNIIFQQGFKPFQVYFKALQSADGYTKAVKGILGSGEHQYLINQTRQRFTEDNLLPQGASGYRRFTDRATEVFYNVNGLKPLTQIFKTISGLFAQHEMIEKSLRFNKLTDMEKWELSRFGIGKREAEILKKSPHTTSSDKAVRYMNMDNWKQSITLNSGEVVTAREAQRIWSQAIKGHQNIMVLTAQASDKFSLVDGVVYAKRQPFMKMFPKFFKTDDSVSLYKIVNKKKVYEREMVRIESGVMAFPFQFWNYGLAAQQKILGAMLDPHKPLSRKIYGGALMVGLGYMIAKSRMPDGMWDKMPLQERLLKGIHMGGVTGMYTDLAYMQSAMFHGMTGLKSKDTGIPTMYNPDFVDAVTEPFGAGVGLTVDTGRAIGKMVGGEVSSGLADLPKPFQYLPIFREYVRDMNRYLRN